jgi:hypothetical protein
VVIAVGVDAARLVVYAERFFVAEALSHGAL